MKDLSLDERKGILLDYQIMPVREIKKKWNITGGTISHIRFVHGKSGAKAGGYYHKDLLSDAVHPIVAQIKEMKAAGYTSAEISHAMEIPLEVVNKNW